MIINGGQDGPDGTCTIRPARYAKGKVAIECPGWHQMKTRAARICNAKGMGGRYTNRERAYIVSKAAAARFVKLYADGWDANIVTWQLSPPRTHAE